MLGVKVYYILSWMLLKKKIILIVIKCVFINLYLVISEVLNIFFIFVCGVCFFLNCFWLYLLFLEYLIEKGSNFMFIVKDLV